MQITVLKEDLQKAISTASRFVSPRPTVPVLSHLLLEAKNGQLRIASTNLETGISVKIGANVQEEGRITVPAKTISEIVSSLPRTKIELVLKEDLLHISAGGFSISLATSPPNDLPTIPDRVEGGFILSLEIFQKVVKEVSFVSSGGDNRPEYSGILFLEKNGGIDVIGTDGVRLSKLSLVGGLGGAEKILVPAGVVVEIPKVFDQQEVNVLMDKEKNQILIGNENRVLTAQLLTFDFPDFEKIIPNSWETRVSVDKKELLDGIQIASVVSLDYKVEFAIENNSFSLSSNNPQLGSQKSSIAAKIEGEDLSVAFNWRFIREFLGAVGGDEVVIELNSASSPGVFKDPKEENFLHLVMPIRAQS